MCALPRPTSACIGVKICFPSIVPIWAEARVALFLITRAKRLPKDHLGPSFLFSPNPSRARWKQYIRHVRAREGVVCVPPLI